MLCLWWVTKMCPVSGLDGSHCEVLFTILTLVMLELEYSCFGGVNTMPVDALAPKVASASASLLLAVQNRQYVGLFLCEYGYLLLNKIQDMIWNVSTYLMNFKTIPHVKSYYTLVPREGLLIMCCWVLVQWGQADHYFQITCFIAGMVILGWLIFYGKYYILEYRITLDREEINSFAWMSFNHEVPIIFRLNVEKCFHTR